MDNSIKESLEHANKMRVFNNQLRLLKEKYLERNIYFTIGHQFTINLQLINYCITLKNQNKIKDVIMLDDYDLPVRIADLEIFYNNCLLYTSDAADEP